MSHAEMCVEFHRIDHVRQNGAMEFSAHHEYAADPQQVHEMLTNHDWLRQVVEHAGGTVREISTEGDTVRLSAESPSPDQVRKLAGDTLQGDVEFRWTQTAQGWKGTMDGKPNKMPAQINATVSVEPGGPGTVVDYNGQFNVSVPFIGKKIESLAAPNVTAIITNQQTIGDRWLAEH